MLLMDGSPKEVADRLTQLVNLPCVSVSPSDEWMPRGKPICENGHVDKTLTNELDLIKPSELVPESIRSQLLSWWLIVRSNRSRTPNWDIASTCTINDREGLILVEAKAHVSELSHAGKSRSNLKSGNSRKNHEQIGRAIDEANSGLMSVTGKQWNITRDSHYQLSNRFAWSWKLASLGVPVILLYLGFLNAHDMADVADMFENAADWERALKKHSNGIVDESCWEAHLEIDSVPLIPLIRAREEKFDPTRN